MLKQLLIVLMLISCGPHPDTSEVPVFPEEMADTTDQEQTPIPTQTPNPTPSPEPTQTPVPPSPPATNPPEEPTDKTLTCEVQWDLPGEPAGRFYKVKYLVLQKATQETTAHLRSSYYYAGRTVDGSKASKTYAAGVANSASVSTYVWEASLSGNTAKIKNNAFNETKEVPCIFSF